jgi:hypothetical protein
VAVVEAAVTLPLLALFAVALIQFVNMIFLRQKITSACYVGMQNLAQANATEAIVHDTVESILTSRGVTNATIDILPQGALDNAMAGTEFSIRVRAPFAGNLSGPRIIPTPNSIQVEQWIFR